MEKASHSAIASLWSRLLLPPVAPRVLQSRQQHLWLEVWVVKVWQELRAIQALRSDGQDSSSTRRLLTGSAGALSENGFLQIATLM
jgi:hypothetical protein